MAKGTTGGTVATGATNKGGLAVVQGTGPAVAVTERVGKGAPAIAPAPVGVPVFKPGAGNSPNLTLEPDLWAGHTGKIVWAGDHLSNGRWVLHTAALAGAQKLVMSSARTITLFHNRAVKGLDYADYEAPELVIVPTTDPKRVQMAAMTAPAPGGLPVMRTALLFDDQAAAEGNGMPSSFYRVYVGKGPKGEAVTVLFPDGYCQHLGDPPALWPSTVAGCWCDGGWVGMFSGGAQLVRAAAGLAAVVSGVKAAPAPDLKPGERSPF